MKGSSRRQARSHLRRAQTALEAIPRDASQAFHWPAAAQRHVGYALAYLLRGADAVFHPPEPAAVGAPLWGFTLGQQVRYCPYVRAGIRQDSTPPELWRVIGRSYTEMAGMSPVAQYTIMPWVLSGDYFCDRPLVVFVDQLQPVEKA